MSTLGSPEASSPFDGAAAAAAESAAAAAPAAVSAAAAGSPSPNGTSAWASPSSSAIARYGAEETEQRKEAAAFYLLPCSRGAAAYSMLLLLYNPDPHTCKSITPRTRLWWATLLPLLSLQQQQGEEVSTSCAAAFICNQQARLRDAVNRA